MDFAKSLIIWYLENKRDLPWRNTTDPYFIWLSEIILQQTRVAQGLPYFFAFTEAFPTVHDLANANEEQVLKLWQGLGYYSRARNLHKTAREIAFEKGGVFPDNYEELIKLTGIGDYTAAAIASFAFNEHVAVVDGNVFRVLSRFFAVDTDISTNSAKLEFKELAQSLIPPNKANVFNQAIMEFGALQCVPKSPNCENCIFSGSCLALKQKRVQELPRKLKKTKVVHKYFHYLVVEDEHGDVLLHKRIHKGIWHNLYQFPLMELDVEKENPDIEGFLKSKLQLDNTLLYVTAYNSSPLQHKLSHQHLHIVFWKVVFQGKVKGSIPKAEAVKFPFPVVIFNFISKYWF